MAFFTQSKAVRYLLGISGPTILALGLWLLLLATNPGRNESSDAGARLAVTRQLWTAGEVAVRHPPHGTEDLWIEIAPDRYVALWGIGQSLVFVPFDMVSSLLEQFTPESWRGQLPWLPIGFGLLPLLGLGYWYALRRLLQEWGLIHPWPTLGALAMMLGTIMFYYAGQAHEENLVGLCLTLSMLFALRLRRRPIWNNALAAGFFAGACLTIRPVSVFALLIVPVLIFTLEGSWTTRSRFVAVTGVATAAVASIVLWYNFARFGNAFTVGHDRMGHLSLFAFDGRSPKVLVSLLFGPGAGLLVLSPVLAIAICGMHQLWKRDRPYVVGMLVALLSCYSFFSAWHDFYAPGWGTRYQIHILPLLAIPVALGLQRLAVTARGRALAVVVFALSVGIQSLSVFATQHIEHFQAECEANALPSHTQGGSSESGTRLPPWAIGRFMSGVRWDERLLNSPVHGQLERRVQNLVRWAAGAPPPPLGDLECRSAMATMWDRYIPNFWGPVYAHRLARFDKWILLFWSMLLGASLLAIGVGLRRELRRMEELDIGPIRTLAGR
jgi:hypothetical protein